MDGELKTIRYFRYCGEANTDPVLAAARERGGELGIRHVVVASETGRSALRAVNAFRGTPVRIVVITHSPSETNGPAGDIPIGLRRREYESAIAKLVESGARIVQSTRPLAPPSRSLSWACATPEAVLDKALGALGQGIKIAIEAALMATDAGEIEEGEEIIACAGTFKGLDTALALRATYTSDFFVRFELHEIIAMPRCRASERNEFDDPNWQGDLTPYYSRLPGGS